MKIHPLLPAIVVGTGSFGLGIVVGYKIAQQNLALRFEQRLEEETRKQKEFYEIATVDKKAFASPEEAAAALIPSGTVLKETSVLDPDAVGILDKIAYHKIAKQYTPEKEEQEPEETPAITFPDNSQVEHHNVFEDKPVIISQDEFSENETNYTQSTLTWYEKDGVLCDERDEVVEEVDDAVGRENLRHFGQDSSDPNILHIRSLRLQMEFEVVKHESSYRQVVLGIDEDPPIRPSGRS